MFSNLWNWVRNREPAATAAAVFAVVAVVGQAVTNLPAEASWTAVASAIVLAVVRQVVTPTGKIP